jgi:hypothetical protein
VFGSHEPYLPLPRKRRDRVALDAHSSEDNVLIGIVLNSMEEARELDRRRRLSVDHEPPSGDIAPAPVVERIAILRAALDELEQELAVAGRPRP